MIVALAVPFALLFGAMFLLMYSHTSSAHQGAATDKKKAGGVWGLAWQYFTITNPVAAGIRDAIGFIIGNARGWVSHWALAAVKPVARWFDGLTELFNRTYTENTAVATDTRDALQRMRHVVIPREIAKEVGPVAKTAGSAVSTATAARARVGHLSEVFTTTHRAQVKLNVHYSHAVDVALPTRIGAINTEIDRLRTDQTKLRDRTTSLENGAVKTWEWIRTHPLSLVTGVFAGAVAIALQRIGLGGLRCRNFTNLLKKYGCGLGTLLDGLLGIVASTLVLENICTLLPLLETAFGEVVGPVTHLLTEVPLGGCEYPPKAWAQLNVAAGPLPPRQALGALPV